MIRSARSFPPGQGSGQHRDVIDFMSGLGCRLSSEQAASAVRTKDPYKGIGTQIFVR